MPKTAYVGIRKARLGHHTLDGPRGQGWETFAYIRFHQPQRFPTSALKNNNIGEQLSQAKWTVLISKHQRGQGIRPEGQTQCSILGPQAIDHVHRCYKTTPTADIAFEIRQKQRESWRQGRRTSRVAIDLPLRAALKCQRYRRTRIEACSSTPPTLPARFARQGAPFLHSRSREFTDSEGCAGGSTSHRKLSSEPPTQKHTFTIHLASNRTAPPRPPLSGKGIAVLSVQNRG